MYPNPPDRRGRRLQRLAKRVPEAVSRSCEHPLTEGSENMYHDGYHLSHHGLAHRAQGPNSSPNLDSDIPISSGHDMPLNDISRPPDSQGRDEAGGWAFSPVNGLESINDSSHSYPTQLRKTGSVRRELASNFDQPPLPSRAIGLSLLEVYFTRIYNASLLFYKPLLFQNYLDGKLPDVLLKTIFALSTLYVPPLTCISESRLKLYLRFLSPSNEGDQESPIQHSELKLLSPYYPCGLPWAKSAQREAMLLVIEEQSLMVTQALECLQLYWFGVGEAYSGNLCLGKPYAIHPFALLYRRPEYRRPFREKTVFMRF